MNILPKVLAVSAALTAGEAAADVCDRGQQELRWNASSSIQPGQGSLTMNFGGGVSGTLTARRGTLRALPRDLLPSSTGRGREDYTPAGVASIGNLQPGESDSAKFYVNEGVIIDLRNNQGVTRIVPVLADYNTRKGPINVNGSAISLSSNGLASFQVNSDLATIDNMGGHSVSQSWGVSAVIICRDEPEAPRQRDRDRDRDDPRPDPKPAPERGQQGRGGKMHLSSDADKPTVTVKFAQLDF